jgi:ferrous-iron efflux pump FieF
LSTRYAGDRIFVEFHLEVDGDLTVDRGHKIGDTVEAAVANLFPGTVEVTGHLEPFGIDDDRLDNRVGRRTRFRLSVSEVRSPRPSTNGS